MPGPGEERIAQADQELSGVDAIAPDDVWAVGVRSDYAPFLRHWDGTRWRPFIGPRRMRDLLAVDHLSSDDVYAGGINGIIHWNGSAWTMSYRAPGPYHVINSLVAISEDEVWGVGSDIGEGSIKVHWDGSTWSEFDGSDSSINLTGVDADRPDDVWAVSSIGVIEHWDGTAWTQMKFQPSNLKAVAVVSPDDVWMAGDDRALPPRVPKATMVHWNGHDLVRVDVPTPGRSSTLASLSVVSATDIWAVGTMRPVHGKARGLIEHWNGRHWRIRPTPDLPYVYSLAGVSAASADAAYAVGSIGGNRFHDNALTLTWDGVAWTRMP